MIKVTFDNKKLNRCASDPDKAQKELGVNCDKYFERLNQINIQDNLSELVGSPGRFHQLKKDKKGIFSLDLVGKDRLLFKPKESITDDNGSIILEKITEIVILSIENTHNKGK
ncbi:killer suppression protein HigA [Candidatus Kapabacteria bacterium]|nr:killer suppression protein HigA [Candidatus Kapabacteria bacterium]